MQTEKSNTTAGAGSQGSAASPLEAESLPRTARLIPPKELAALITARGAVLWLLDYDNTLAESAPRPVDARLVQSGREALSALASSRGNKVGIVSARNVEQFPPLLQGLEDTPIIISGFYGRQLLDFRAGRYLLQEEPKFEAAAKASWTMLERYIREDPRLLGAFLEWKRFSVAFHYRDCQDASAYDSAIAAVTGTIAANALSTELELKQSRNLLEACPKNCDKADGVRLIYSLFGTGCSTVFIGDDAPDESSFSLVNSIGGFSIKVAPVASETAANYRLKSVSDVHELLNQAAQLY